MKNKYKALLIGLISITIFCIGCNVEFQEITDFPFEEVLVVKADLPDNWKWWANDWIERNVYSVKYESDEGILLTHQVGVFSSKETAEIAYDEWEEKWFTGGWQPRAEAVFIPDNSQDQYRYACIDVIANGKLKSPCTFLQQHNRFVSLVLIGIDGESITFDEFNQLLQALDDKLNAFE